MIIKKYETIYDYYNFFVNNIKYAEINIDLIYLKCHKLLDEKLCLLYNKDHNKIQIISIDNFKKNNKLELRLKYKDYFIIDSFLLSDKLNYLNVKKLNNLTVEKIESYLKSDKYVEYIKRKIITVKQNELNNKTNQYDFIEFTIPIDLASDAEITAYILDYPKANYLLNKDEIIKLYKDNIVNFVEKSYIQEYNFYSKSQDQLSKKLSKYFNSFIKYPTIKLEDKKYYVIKLFKELSTIKVDNREFLLSVLLKIFIDNLYYYFNLEGFEHNIDELKTISKSDREFILKIFSKPSIIHSLIDPNSGYANNKLCLKKFIENIDQDDCLLDISNNILNLNYYCPKNKNHFSFSNLENINCYTNKLFYFDNSSKKLNICAFDRPVKKLYIEKSEYDKLLKLIDLYDDMNIDNFFPNIPIETIELQ